MNILCYQKARQKNECETVHLSERDNILENFRRMYQVILRPGINGEGNIRECAQPFCVVGVLGKVLRKLGTTAKCGLANIIKAGTRPVTALAAYVETPLKKVNGVDNVKESRQIFGTPSRCKNAVVMPSFWGFVNGVDLRWILLFFIT
jgi:hypothetical protein